MGWWQGARQTDRQTDRQMNESENEMHATGGTINEVCEMNDIDGDVQRAGASTSRPPRRVTWATDATGGVLVDVRTYTVGSTSGDELKEIEESDMSDMGMTNEDDTRTKKVRKKRKVVRPTKAERA